MPLICGFGELAVTGSMMRNSTPSKLVQSCLSKRVCEGDSLGCVLATIVRQYYSMCDVLEIESFTINLPLRLLNEDKIKILTVNFMHIYESYS